MKKITFILAVVVLMVVSLSSCNNNSKKNNQKSSKIAVKKGQKKLSGTYVCTEHWNDALVGSAKIIFSGDNKVNFSGIGNTSYRINGDSIYIDMKSYEMTFKIDGNTLRASGPTGKVVYTKK